MYIFFVKKTYRGKRRCPLTVALVSYKKHGLSRKKKNKNVKTTEKLKRNERDGRKKKKKGKHLKHGLSAFIRARGLQYRAARIDQTRCAEELHRHDTPPPPRCTTTAVEVIVLTFRGHRRFSFFSRS